MKQVKDKLVQIIQNEFPSSNANEEAWKDVLSHCEVVPSICHLLNTTQYYAAYFSLNQSINLSFVLYINKQPIGIMPLIARKNEINGWILSSGTPSHGEEIVEPIFVKNLPRKIKRRLESQLVHLIYLIAKELKVKYCQFTNTGYWQLSSWYLLLSSEAQEIFPTHHLLVDLSLSLKKIKLNFRKSYRPLINKGLKDLNIKIHQKISDKLFEEFRAMHKDIAGRITRPIESWSEQKKQIDASESFLITVSDDSGNMIGGGLFTGSHYQGNYCVGAYRREFFDKPLGHVVQMKAIEIFKSKGLHWYEIGPKHLKVDKNPGTDKELSISHFKEGFSTHVVARQHLVIRIKDISNIKNSPSKV